MKYIILFLLFIIIYTFWRCKEGFESQLPPLPPPLANLGTNIWRSPFNNSLQEFDKRYKIKSELSYPLGYSLTGEFYDDGPIASNS